MRVEEEEPPPCPSLVEREGAVFAERGRAVSKVSKVSRIDTVLFMIMCGCCDVGFYMLER